MKAESPEDRWYTVLGTINPVKVAEFSKTRLESDPAFRWQVQHVLKKRDAITSNVTSRAWKTSHEFGVEMPTNIDHDKRLDTMNSNALRIDGTDSWMPLKDLKESIPVEVAGIGKLEPRYGVCLMLVDSVCAEERGG